MRNWLASNELSHWEPLEKSDDSNKQLFEVISKAASTWEYTLVQKMEPTTYVLLISSRSQVGFGAQGVAEKLEEPC